MKERSESERSKRQTEEEKVKMREYTCKVDSNDRCKIKKKERN